MRKALLLFIVLLLSAFANTAVCAEKSDDMQKSADNSASDEAIKSDNQGENNENSDSQKHDSDKSGGEEKGLKKHKGDSDPMAPFAIAPRLGYGWFGPARGDFKIGDLSARNALLINLGLNMGGSGAGFDLVPYYAYEKGDSAFHSLGFGMQFTYRWLLERKWYPHFGFGSKIGYIFASDIDLGLEMYLRIPVGVSYYFLEDLGVIFDFGFGYGFTGIMPKNVDTVYEFDDLRFGHGFMVDLSLGLTFP